MESEVFSTHERSCRGIKENGEPAFERENAEPIIVVIRKNGGSCAMCRYAFIYSLPGYCNWQLKNVKDDKGLHRCLYDK